MKESFQKSHLTHQEFPAPVYFLDRSSMLVHMAKHHKDDPRRPRNQNSTFDKARDAKDGLRICRHCNKTLCDWSSLRKHIQEKRCPVLFAIPVREAGVTQPSLQTPVAPSEAQVTCHMLRDHVLLVQCGKLCSRNTSDSPCEHCGAVTKAPRHCTLAAMCLRNHGCGHSGVLLRGPPTEIWRCSTEGGTWQGHCTGSQSPPPKATDDRSPPAQNLCQVVKALARLAL